MKRERRLPAMCFDDHREAVRLGVDRHVQLIVRRLRQRAFGEPLHPLELDPHVGEPVAAEVGLVHGCTCRSSFLGIPRCSFLVRAWQMRSGVAGYSDSGAGVSGTGHRMRVNCPRWSSSRPLPPRPVTSYFAVLIVCSAPRLVSTVSRSRSPVDAMNPSTRSDYESSLIRITPRPGPDR